MGNPPANTKHQSWGLSCQAEVPKSLFGQGEGCHDGHRAQVIGAPLLFVVRQHTAHAAALPNTAGDRQETWGRGERRPRYPDTPLMGWDGLLAGLRSLQEAQHRVKEFGREAQGCSFFPCLSQPLQGQTVLDSQ